MQIGRPLLWRFGAEVGHSSARKEMHRHPPMIDNPGHLLSGTSAAMGRNSY